MGRSLLVLALLMATLACGKPNAAPPAPARLVIHFLDQDATCGLPEPLPGSWQFMNAGTWEPVDTIWTGHQGRAVIPRTAPDWVMLEDPEGNIHRIVVREGREHRDEPPSLSQGDREEQAEGLFILWIWLSQVFRPR